jgi:small subunit ribosomal protein S8e
MIIYLKLIFVIINKL